MAAPIRVNSKDLDEDRSYAPLAEEFHFTTLLTPLNAARLASFIARYDTFQKSSEAELISAFVYPGMDVVKLENNRDSKDEDYLSRLLFQRESTTRIERVSITLTQLSTILDNAHGLRQSHNTKLRSTPSAGASHSVEIYLLVWNIEGLTPGVYHHNVLDHSLEIISSTIDPIENLLSVTEVWKEANTLIVLSNVLPRVTMKYGERGYRFALLETGHVSQNILLTTTQEHIPSTVLGNYYDHKIANLIGADGKDHIISSCIVI